MFGDSFKSRTVAALLLAATSIQTVAGQANYKIDTAGMLFGRIAYTSDANVSQKTSRKPRPIWLPRSSSDTKMVKKFPASNPVSSRDLPPKTRVLTTGGRLVPCGLLSSTTGI